MPLPSVPGAPGCLSTTLPEAVGRQFEVICKALFVDPAEAEGMSPLEAANEVSSLRLAQRDWEAASGIDWQIAVLAGPKLEFLEVDSDLASALRSVPLVEQVSELEYVISDRYLQDVDAAVRAWFDGSEDVLHADVEAAWQRAPRLAQRLYGDRNLTMTVAVTTAVSTGRAAVFVVGAAHAYGSNGILAILKNAGMAVSGRS